MLIRADECRRFIIAFLVLSLTACGGGGGGGGGGAADDSGPDGEEEAPTVVEAPFGISGTITIPHNAQIDGDTMGAQGLLQSATNNLLQSAQPIANPVMLSGYVSRQSGSYKLDAARGYARDEVDYFVVELLAGQSVRLQLYPADEGRDNLADSQQFAALTLYDYQSMAAVNQLDDLNTEVASSGRYYIEVASRGAPALYTLSISQQISTLSDPGIDSEAEFADGEVLVKFKVQMPALRSAFNDTQAVSSEVVPDLTGAEVVAGNNSTGWRLQIADATASAFSVKDDQRSGLRLQKGIRQRTLEYIAELRQRDDVAWAEPNYLRRAYLEPADELYPLQWHYPLINLASAWDSSTGSGVSVAVIDTGIVTTHSEFAGQLLPGYDFVSTESSARDGDEADGTEIDDDPSDTGATSHGTHVAGTVAAANDNRGVVGVAFDAEIMPIRVLGSDGQGLDSDIIEGIRFAAGLDNASGQRPERRADIINLSLGGPSSSAALKAAIDEAEAAGVLVIAAAGNEATSRASYPAAYDTVVSVSAVDQSKQLAPYSNYGAIDVAAPGGNIVQDLNSDGNPDGVLSSSNSDDGSGAAYAWYQGTSMAAPHVSGVAALMISVKKLAGEILTPSEFRDYLRAGELTENIGSKSFYGAGLIDAARALQALDGDISPYVAISPAAISITGLSSETSFTVLSGGALPVSVRSLQSNVPWLTVIAEDVDERGLGRYSLRAEREGFSTGEVRAALLSVTAQVDGGGSADLQQQVNVLVKQPDPRELSSVGALFVGLIRREVQDAAEAQQAESIELYKIVEAQRVEGEYRYQFNDVESGEYFIFASTNMDQDSRLSDYGEAEGEYPVLGAKQRILIGPVEATGQQIDGIDFTVSNLTTLTSPSATSATFKQTKRIPPEMMTQSLRQAL
ncbi:serine protease [Sinobacterium caligoides]|uniref:Serine protease n=1 Tax=Sinobacterium caligoides TaxID=933926 RepID=A0A3N2DFW9_9GAMM|nr:S8 family serine peptidase [Sinobacterium caligoides]ROR98696.1 serine protease [Sinobacterium caligoides]